MAVLSESDRAEIHAQWMRENNIPCGAFTKAELRAAVDAIDDWIDTNSSAFNTAIPQPARAELSAKQKAWLLAVVVQRRFNIA